MSTHPVVRIHIAQFDAFDESVGTDWLTADETARLEAMTAPQRRRSFLAGHWLARHTASQWLNLDPARIAVHRHADGRPCLHVAGGDLGNDIMGIMRSYGQSETSVQQAVPAPSPFLSISHSGSFVCVALATVPIGIDLELSRRRRNIDALAKFAFSAEEAARISAMEASQRAAAFHQLWTLKEARGKRTGEGFLPEQSRKLTATATTAEQAEAISWAFQGGSLALAVDPGLPIGTMRIDFVNEPEPAGRTYWGFQRH